MVALSSVLLPAAFTFKRRAIDRWEGTPFLAIYRLGDRIFDQVGGRQPRYGIIA